MTTNILLGIAIFVTVLLIATWQWAFALGREVGTKRERQLADRRVNGVLAEERARKPSGRIPQRKRLTYRKVDAKSVGKKRYLNSKLAGEVVA